MYKNGLFTDYKNRFNVQKSVYVEEKYSPELNIGAVIYRINFAALINVAKEYLRRN